MTQSASFTQIPKVYNICSIKMDLNMSHRRWIRIFKYYDYEIVYRPGKENIVVDALSGNKMGESEHVKENIVSSVECN